MAPTTRNSLFELPVRRQGTIQRVAKLRTRHRAGSTERGRGLQILGVTGVVRYWLYQFGVGAAPKVGKTNGGRRPSILLERRGGLLGSIVAARRVAWASFLGLWAPLGSNFGGLGAPLGFIFGALGLFWAPGRPPWPPKVAKAKFSHFFASHFGTILGTFWK